MPTTTYLDSTLAVSAIGSRTDAAGAAVTDYTAEEARFTAQILTGGYLQPAEAFVVREAATPNMSVVVGSGTAKADYYVVAGGVGGQGNYIVRLDVAAVAVQVPAADASQQRTDQLYLVVQDDTYDASSRGLPRLGYRRGDLGGVVPGPDAGWEASALLATIPVTAGATTITDEIITDGRTAATLRDELVVTDHGGLQGLADDDHPQYHTDERGDVRYYTKAVLDSILTTKSATTHTHSASGIVSGVLDLARLPTGSSSATVALGSHTHPYSSSTHGHDPVSSNMIGSNREDVLYNSGGGQNVPRLSNTYVKFQGENNLFGVAVTGIYAVTTTIRFTSGGPAGERYAALTNYTTGEILTANGGDSNGSAHTINLHWAGFMTPGSYFGTVAFQNSSSTLTLDTAPGWRSLRVTLIRRCFA